VYRDYLEERWRAPFDEQLAANELAVMANPFVAEWDEETGDHEMKAAYDPDTRDRVHSWSARNCHAPSSCSRPRRES
jgi:hypothetical protein